MSKIIKPIIVLGPTAVGKTALAIKLAQKYNGEIISLDSMQVYQGMDIGSAKPTPEELASCPHHMIDCFPLKQSSNVAAFLEKVEEAQADIVARGKLPIFAGGTALYVKTLVDGIFEGPKASAEIRADIEAQIAEHGTEWVHQNLLLPIDPAAAARIHYNDIKRVSRAIEVYRTSGVPLSHHQQQWKQAEPSNDYIMIGLMMPRKLLYDRIELRIDQMLEQGLLIEVETLLKKGLAENSTASQAIGYKELIEYLTGDIKLERAVELIKRNTRRFAKHQLTWFRKDPRILWCDITKYSPADLINKVEECILYARNSDGPPLKI